jgi:hypothetical protein
METAWSSRAITSRLSSPVNPYSVHPLRLTLALEDIERETV